jgi:hypothetical protein
VNAVGLQGARVVSASGDGKMILWDVGSGARLRTFEGHDRGLACIEFKAGLIVSGSNDCKIKVWDAQSGACVRTLVGHTALVRALAFDPAAGRLVSAGYDRTVKVWDLARGTLVREFRGEHASHIFDVRFDVRRIVRCVRRLDWVGKGADGRGMQHEPRPEDRGVRLWRGPPAHRALRVMCVFRVWTRAPPSCYLCCVLVCSRPHVYTQGCCEELRGALFCMWGREGDVSES